jgi:hypothetical protein
VLTDARASAVCRIETPVTCPRSSHRAVCRRSRPPNSLALTGNGRTPTGPNAGCAGNPGEILTVLMVAPHVICVALGIHVK